VNRLLDVSVLLALLIEDHPHHASARAWMGGGVRPVVCPITQLGLVRIASNTYRMPVIDALKVLGDFMADADFIACDLSLVAGRAAPASAKTTDWYLADLAEKHGMKWATFDGAAKHPAAELVPSEHPPAE
jgi:predicted nucleic acid-binding protein